MPKTSYGRTVEILEETLETEKTSLCGISDLKIHTLRHEEHMGCNVTLKPGKYARVDVTIFVGPL